MTEDTGIWRDVMSMEGPVDWAEWFGAEGAAEAERPAEGERPVEMEIGCGKGLFLASAAVRHPEINWVGVEKDGKFLNMGLERLQKREVPNVRLAHGNVSTFLTNHVPDGSIRNIHVYFPDPWPKRRHAKRRVFREGAAEQFARALSDGGLLILKTDVPANFTRIRRAVNASERFDLEEMRAWPSGQGPEGNMPTSYEVKYAAIGKETFYARWKKRG